MIYVILDIISLQNLSFFLKVKSLLNFLQLWFDDELELNVHKFSIVLLNDGH